MTLVTFLNESELSTTSKVGVPSLDFDTSSKAGNFRFTLRKRSHDFSPEVNMSSYNSAFLSGLFADVARVAQSDDEDTTTDEQEDARLDLSMPVKRSRVSLTKSFSRCARSYKNLTEVSSPVGVDAFPSITTTTTVEPSCSASMERINSLAFQLNCVDPSPKSVKSVVDIIDMAFPHLPATVSDSSCSTTKQQDLTRGSDQQASELSETTLNKESYGWFVELDDGDDDTPVVPTTIPTSRSDTSLDLAFSASTAPKRVSNYEAELEWAQAADTVDDVLGDFF
ncbi:expressed unknown protein [Seminavis robusta]|uniref:Uncharacterized protein n=1 Tax=Seminavis robusta TaxID=568900 RepID=A0A9N8D6M6_9STRA|nr:expressed unknown protein [Seminavis robusta]|eukprot:Sro19_g013390.1 n/a (282) ;mRNA; r:55415-56260